MIILGVDPGLSGAVCSMDEQGNVLMISDTPTLLVASGKKIRREYNVSSMIVLLEPAKPGDQAFIEKVQPMPGEGVRSVFSMGYGFGLWMALLACKGIKTTVVTPQRWKHSLLDGMPKEKQSSILRAQQLFPNIQLTRKKDHNKADALLIAFYGLKLWHGKA